MCLKMFLPLVICPILLSSIILAAQFITPNVGDDPNALTDELIKTDAFLNKMKYCPAIKRKKLETFMDK